MHYPTRIGRSVCMFLCKGDSDLCISIHLPISAGWVEYSLFPGGPVARFDRKVGSGIQIRAEILTAVKYSLPNYGVHDKNSQKDFSKSSTPYLVMQIDDDLTKEPPLRSSALINTHILKVVMNLNFSNTCGMTESWQWKFISWALRGQHGGLLSRIASLVISCHFNDSHYIVISACHLK